MINSYDGEGLMGAWLHYAFLFSMTLSAIILFIVLLKKNRLDMCEGAQEALFDKSLKKKDKNES